jgi:chemotaxis protein MotB
MEPDGLNQHAAPSHERWMISYADFMTLLFAVFVVLFTSASTDKNTAKQVSEAVVVALKSGTISFISRSRTPGPVNTSKDAQAPAAGSQLVEQRTVVELVPSLKALSEQFQDEIAKGKIEVFLEPRGLVISLRQAAFFPSGQAALNPDTYPIVDKIATLIQSLPNRVNLEGHTDAVPIRNSRFASNWELSAARSIAMLDLLTGRNKLPRNRLSVAGYADTVPVESNDDPQGRAHNRRVDVIILNEILPKSSLKTASH